MADKVKIAIHQQKKEKNLFGETRDLVSAFESNQTQELTAAGLEEDLQQL